MQLPNAARLKSQMPSSLEKFIQQLKDSSLVTDETLKNFIPPAASPEDAVELDGVAAAFVNLQGDL